MSIVTRMQCITCRRKLTRERARDGSDPQVCEECRRSTLYTVPPYQRGAISAGIPLDPRADPMLFRCGFCHAPPGVRCLSRFYEEHLEHGNAREHDTFHSSRIEASMKGDSDGSGSK